MPIFPHFIGGPSRGLDAQTILTLAAHAHRRLISSTFVESHSELQLRTMEEITEALVSASFRL